MKNQETLTLKEFESNPQKALNEVLISGSKKLILINGKIAVEIVSAQDKINTETKLKKLQEENDALKYIIGAKRGLEDYQKCKLIDHNMVRDKFEKYLTK